MSVSELLVRYENGPAILRHATSSLDPEQSRQRVAPGLWSIAELVAHVVDADLVLADRMKRVIAEEDPPLLAFSENAWLARLGYQNLKIEDGLSLFGAHRAWMLQILKQLDPPDYARTGQHSESGRKTLAVLVIQSCNHLDHHLKFLYGKRATLGSSVYPRFTREPDV